MKATRIAAVGLIVMTLGACGSSKSDGGGPPGPGLSRQLLSARADAICAAARTRTGTTGAPGSLYSDAAAAAAYFDRIFPITDQETKQLQALMPARDVAGDWRAFVGAQVAADQLLATLKRYADVKDPHGLAYLSRIEPAGRRTAAAAAKVGARICAGAYA
jgi:hypothetical protein